MTATNGRVSFGIKTSQSNVTYDEILKVLHTQHERVRG